VTIAGAGSTWTNSGDVYVGFLGAGSVTQTGGTVSVANTLYLGYYSSNGTYNLNGGTLVLKSLTKGDGTAASISAAELFRPATILPPACP